MADPNDTIIRDMIAEWHDLESARHAARADRVAARVDSWERALTSMVSETADIKARGEWVSGPRDLLGVLGRARRETTHCRILAWLLDPAGAHGLGTALLEAVLRECKVGFDVPPQQWGHVRTRCEVVAPRSRADIVVFGDGFKIVIEAKVDAVERDQQCDDLYADHHLNAHGGIETCFIFLTPQRRAPTSATGEANEAFKCLSFVQIRIALASLVREHEEQMRKTGGWHAVMAWLDTLEREFR